MRQHSTEHFANIYQGNNGVLFLLFLIVLLSGVVLNKVKEELISLLSECVGKLGDKGEVVSCFGCTFRKSRVQFGEYGVIALVLKEVDKLVEIEALAAMASRCW